MMLARLRVTAMLPARRAMLLLALITLPYYAIMLSASARCARQALLRRRALILALPTREQKISVEQRQSFPSAYGAALFIPAPAISISRHRSLPLLPPPPSFTLSRCAGCRRLRRMMMALPRYDGSKPTHTPSLPQRAFAAHAAPRQIFAPARAKRHRLTEECRESALRRRYFLMTSSRECKTRHLTGDRGVAGRRQT